MDDADLFWWTMTILARSTDPRFWWAVVIALILLASILLTAWGIAVAGWQFIRRLVRKW